MSKTYRAVVEPSKEAIDVWADNKEDAVTMDRMELLFTVGDRSETKITPDDLVRSLLRDAHLARWMDLASVEQIDADECIGLRPAPGSPELEPEPEVCGICRKEPGPGGRGAGTACASWPDPSNRPTRYGTPEVPARMAGWGISAAARAAPFLRPTRGLGLDANGGSYGGDGYARPPPPPTRK